MKHQAVLSLGSNIGDKISFLEKAQTLILEKSTIINVSSNYASESWGFESDSFVNNVLVVETDLFPIDFLKFLKEIEISLGRTKKSVNGLYSERTIDIDIIYYDDLILNTEELTIPHKLMQERNFVLAPLVEVLPNFIHPVFQKSNRVLLKESRDKGNVVKIKST